MGDPNGPPSAGWRALADGDWAAAAASFEGSVAGGSAAAADLDGLGRARWWEGDAPGAVEAWERAYAAYRRERLETKFSLTPEPQGCLETKFSLTPEPQAVLRVGAS
jgi:hypothetical protein